MLLIVGVAAVILACNPATIGRGGSLNVFPGPTPVDWGGTFDFGGTGIGLQSPPASFTIMNVGYASVTFDSKSAITISGTNAADFVVSTQPAASVPVGSSTSVSLIFKPSTVSAESAQIAVVSNLGSYNFTVSGTGTYSGALQLSYTTDGSTWYTLVSGGSVAFPNITSAAGYQTVQFRIANADSADPLALVGSSPVSITTTTGLYAVVTLPVSPVQAGSYTSFVIQETYLSPGTYGEDVTLRSSDPTSPTLTFSVTGTQS
jgi:hypothetical protein